MIYVILGQALGKIRLLKKSIFIYMFRNVIKHMRIITVVVVSELVNEVSQ